MGDDVIYFKRKMYDTMLRWKSERNGDTALLIQGARRIGKSTIVEDFARREYKSYILIDFSKVSKEVNDLFNDISDLNYLFLRLQFIYQVQLYERESVIIFDEVQLQPLARQAIKHLVKDHRYDYIETGSLISVRSKSRDIVIPSEETKVNMYPMDYEEFRWALGDTATVPLLRTAFEKKLPLGNAVHRKLMRDFRLYMLVGGMPQAVSAYIITNNFTAVDLAKRDIIALYEEDFGKIDDSGRAKAMYDAIPAQLSKNALRYQIGKALNNEKVERMVNVVKEMEDSMTVNVAYHSDDPNAGLALTKNEEYFKMYASDTGLFVTLAFKDRDITENIIYDKLLNDKLSTNLGYVYENVIAQMLRTAGKNLFYHTIPYSEGKKYYEIDFVIPDKHKISPIEVKSSGYKTHRSLDEFCSKFPDRIMNKYLIYTKDYRRENGIEYIPVYMTMFL
ncbi:MAG: ATP-binding protein [Bacteroidaceae bacterium]|jgi:predicted AAA+ superfamily ATPase|nr:ATP-binding protein [Bacteroidaceae bacterium]MBP8602372.1 ATP-binding protein [Bacteroidaceae bacterium]HOD68818.1 AAA family ATPase [Bacteroidaceae bacterium]HQL26298.1 AAA family ATPase [Bacteroidaceae bacterium]